MKARRRLAMLGPVVTDGGKAGRRIALEHERTRDHDALGRLE